MWLFALFLAVPMIEIALFIQIGGAIGLGPTLLVVILTAVLGTILVRREGLRALDELRRSLERLNDPAMPLAHGAMILFAGALLLTPGFFTDAVGFLLLVPAFRTAALAWLRHRVTVQSFTYGPAGDRPDPAADVIDGEFEEIAPEPRPTHRPDRSTRH